VTQVVEAMFLSFSLMTKGTSSSSNPIVAEEPVYLKRKPRGKDACFTGVLATVLQSSLIGIICTS